MHWEMSSYLGMGGQKKLDLMAYSEKKIKSKRNEAVGIRHMRWIWEELEVEVVD